MKLDRSQLPPGVLSLAINNRLRKKVAEPRPGILPPVFANILNPDMIRGWGVYSNPNGDEVLLIADSAEVHVIADGTYPDTIAVDGVLATTIEFVQAHDKVFIFQGITQKQLVWDGVSEAGFVAITKSDPADTSTKLIPPAITAEHINDRLVMIKDSNNVLASDIGDYTSYDPILEVFYVDNDSGATDAVKRVFGYAKGISIIFSSRSISLLLDFTDDPALARVELLNSKLGLAGRKAVVMLGGDVLFLSEPGGIYRVAQSFESRQQVVPLPITDPIQPLIERINWKAATGAVAETVGEYVYFAVPIDGSLTNNAVIVYNGATDVVEGYDSFPAGFQIDDLKVTLYQGERRLFALDKAACRIYVMYEGKSDFVYAPVVAGAPELVDNPPPVEHEIEHTIETRGYSTQGWNSAPTRDFKRMSMGIETWSPSLVVTQLGDDAGDERVLTPTPITRSRTEYTGFAKADWDPTNANLDWDTPGREDYSITANDTGWIPGETGGIDPERKQASVLKFSTKLRGTSVAYRITNGMGAAIINWVQLESSETVRAPRRGS
jgi:hypothetical protein